MKEKLNKPTLSGARAVITTKDFLKVRPICTRDRSDFCSSSSAGKKHRAPRLLENFNESRLVVIIASFHSSLTPIFFFFLCPLPPFLFLFYFSFSRIYGQHFLIHFFFLLLCSPLYPTYRFLVSFLFLINN